MFRALKATLLALWREEECQKQWMYRIGISFVIVVCIHFMNRPPPVQKPEPQLESAPRKVASVEKKQEQESISKVNTERNDGELEKKDKNASGVVDSKPPTAKPAVKAKKVTPVVDQKKPNQLPSSQDGPPPFLRSGSKHPGMDAYWYWHDVETSLFRIYTIGVRASERDSFSAVPPYNPSSRRGNVQVSLKVTNRLDHEVHVFWVDYKGKEIPKGTIAPGGLWLQTTYIDHPWVFRKEDDALLMHYVPYKIIPTTAMAATVDPSDPNVGMHRFSIRPPADPLQACSIDDPILPYPAKNYIVTPQLAMDWAFLHCTRMSFDEWDLLLKYTSKIVQDSGSDKYRSLRMANRQFGPRLWQSTAKGLFLAAGFYENAGYVQVGGPDGLTRERVQELSVWIWMVEQWRQKVGDVSENQPLGADGFGRAGFGRAGSMGSS